MILSSVHLFEWAKEPINGLGLVVGLAWVPIMALDATSLTCVSMVTYAAWRGEHAGAFHLLTWAVAGVSAWANYVYGITTPSRFDQLFFPIMSISGPLILDITLFFVRRWYRIDTRMRYKSVKITDFGSRWMPTVAFNETLEAWRVGKREGIDRAEDAVARVREIRRLSTLSGPDAVRFAWAALGTHDVYAACSWLSARGRDVAQADVDAATAGLPTAPTGTAQNIINPSTPATGTSLDVEEHHRSSLGKLTSKRDMIRYAFHAIGSRDPGHAIQWLSDRGVTVSKSEANALAREGGTDGRPHLSAVPAT